MKEKLKTALNSKELCECDEYGHAGEFYSRGFKRISNLIGIRLYEYLNIDCNDNNKAEEMLLCLYYYLHPEMKAVDSGIHSCCMAQHFDFKAWEHDHEDLQNVTLGDLLLAKSINCSALLTLFDLLTWSFYKSDEYDSRHYKYSDFKELKSCSKKGKACCTGCGGITGRCF